MSGHKFNAPQAGELFDILRKDCGPWVAQSKWAPVYRGSKMIDPYDDFVKIATRPDKQDPDVPPTIQKAFDFALEQRGHKALLRNSVHVSGDVEEATTYGRVFVIFPIGNFDITWSPEVKALMGALVKDGKAIAKLKDLLHTYKTDDLLAGIRSGNEILVKCNEYYKLDLALWREISAQLMCSIAQYLSKKSFLPKNARFQCNYIDIFSFLS